MDRGTGVPIVFLHAGSGNSGLWSDQVEFFSAAGYRCIAYDRRAQAAAADELEALATQLGLDRFHLVGTAAGGIVAIDYALSFAKRLRSLVVANSIFGVKDEAYQELTRRLRPSPQFDALPVEVRELGPSYRAANPEGARRWAEASRHASPQATRNRITFAALETIRLPTLLLTGDADLYMPPSLLREIAPRIRGAVSVVVPECGHSAFWEQPEIFNRAVLEFIGQN
ncbi:MAG TPA: alpha/beta fold hydrolase [Burkholderiales bacterium]|nr:alpha/beta fold hydrolase [Burkholderiales bacterium]